MTLRQEASIYDFTVPHPLRHSDGQGLIGCMDRRLVLPGDPVLGDDRLFQQLRGGRWGLGAVATAMEANKPNSFIDLGIDVAHFAQSLGSALQNAGILLTKHGRELGPSKCGGISGASVIQQGMTRGLEDPAMYANTKIIKPDITDTTYERIVDAEKRIYKAGRAPTPKTINDVLTTPSAVSFWIPDATHSTAAATPHVDLDETDHDTIKFGVDYREGVAFDRAAAHEQARLGGYYSSFGAFPEMLDHVPDAVQEAVGSVETWWAVESVYIGRISTHDIVHVAADGSRHPYPIEVIA